MKTTPYETHCPLSERLATAVLGTLRNYKNGAPPVIEWVDAMADCRVSLRTEMRWIKYRRGISYAQYAVRAMRQCPISRSLDGLLTLGAIEAPDLAADGERVYRAAWARPARGRPVTEAGFIVYSGQYHAHGRTVAAARGSIRRQMLAATEGRWAEAVVRSLEAGHLNGHDVTVTRSDAIRSGSCPSGVDGWIERHLDGRRQAKVSEILAVPAQHERVLAACVVAIRRHRGGQVPFVEEEATP